MKTRWLLWAAGLAVAAAGSVADAHELVCIKQVNQQSVVTIDKYPTTIHYSFTIINTHPTDPSDVLGAIDALLLPYGWAFTPNPPFTLPVAGSATSHFPLTINSYEDCQKLSLASGVRDPIGYQASVMNTMVVKWDLGEAQCSALVICLPTPPPPPPPGGGATRTMGFFKTHESALQQCLDMGDIDLGFITVSSLPSALGFLWGSPAKFADNTAREDLDKARFLLARQTLVGICNQRLFGTAPSPSDLLTDAVAALAGTDCALIHALATQVDDFNNSGDANPFPMGFVPGAATPGHAQSIASDPTSPSGEVCQ